MELTIVERLKLVEMLPESENIITLKISRKLRESLSFSEAEIKLMDARYEFKCVEQGCENGGLFPTAPKCGEHDVLMRPTGRLNMNLAPEIQGKIKDVHMGPQALVMVCDVLKCANESKKLTEAHISLYDKFFPPVVEEAENIVSNKKSE